LPDPHAHGFLNSGCIDELTQDGADPVPAVNADVTDWNASYAQGGGGMTSTLADLGVWGNSMVGSTQLTGELATERLSTELLEGVGGYGLGIMQLGRWYGHAGEAIGWEDIVLHDPATGITFVAAVNACNGATLDFIGLLGTLYPN
jgi:D-alanyl-D-alanine carboxypeptidase